MISRRPNILLGVTGSVAAVKFPKLVLELREFAEVRVVLTKGALAMMNAVESYDVAAYRAYRASVEAGDVLQYTDADEWDGYKDVGKDPVLHIQVARDARTHVLT